MSTRHSVASRSTEHAPRSFADDVAYYLSLTPRQLPSRYLYDELGSALFESICHLPWYRITRTERQLLHAHAQDVFARIGHLSTIVELGPGNGAKLATLLAERPDRPLTVHLIDVSRTALDLAAGALNRGPSLTIVAHQTTYENGLLKMGEMRRGAGATLIAFLGSNIGNFDPPGANAFLLEIRRAMADGDCLLIGTDLVKPERDLQLAYDDPLGVTAAFNRNLLVRVNRELGGDFDLENFSHRAIWNGAESRVEMHLVSRARQRVRVRAADLDITFEPGETIWTESSYKYRVEDLPEMLGAAGLRLIDRWVAAGFALSLATTR
jgi:L-histidine Nalpha-methyltransferase